MFLLYLSSTESGKGGTEFLLGSEKLTLESEIKKIYWANDDEALKDYKSLYVPPEAGKLIISLAHIIHRGGRSTGSSNISFNRSMLRWQSTDKVDQRTIHYIPTYLIPDDIKSRSFLAGNGGINIPSSLERNADNYPTSFNKNYYNSLMNLVIKIFKPFQKVLKFLKTELKRSSKRDLIKKIIKKIIFYLK